MAEKTMGVLQLPRNGMDLEATLYCGQSFVWHRGENGRHTGVAGDRAAVVWADGEWLCIQSLTPPRAEDAEFWRYYFAMDIDYPALQARFCAGHKKLAACIQHARGVRVLRQPFFDTLLQFIISQNNHLARITGIVERLCETFGPQLAPGVYGLPGAQRLAGLAVEELAPLRAGFRAKYLLDAALCVADGRVDEAALRAMDDEEAREALCRIHGVGVKVADCVLLYSLDRRRVVPMDVWMKRAMESLFPKGLPRCAGGNEGIAQQYIFIWAREHL